MKINTIELSGAALDFSVAVAIGVKVLVCLDSECMCFKLNDGSLEQWKPSEDWSQGGPLIEAYKVQLYHHEKFSGCEGAWEAHCGSEFVLVDTPDTFGKSPLVAGCRAIVMEKLGEEVEIPDELCDESK